MQVRRALEAAGLLALVNSGEVVDFERLVATSSKNKGDFIRRHWAIPGACLLVACLPRAPQSDHVPVKYAPSEFSHPVTL